MNFVNFFKIKIGKKAILIMRAHSAGKAKDTFFYDTRFW